MFQKSKACEISNITHQKGNAWDMTIKEKGENSLMDYFLKFNENSKIPYDEAQESFKEFFEAIHNFHLEPTN